tara:strand:- start:856 stop:1491 length:636 start_codon:yes stop_codon:yes gene_type:complete
MKIYFDGGSTTGCRYLGEDYLDKRWSKLLCDKLGAEEYNYAISGGSNHRVLRNISSTYYNKKYDLAVIGLVFWSRTEYYNSDKNKFDKVKCPLIENKKHINLWHKLANLPENELEDTKSLIKEKNTRFWDMYYRNIYDEEYGKVFEEMAYNSIKSICKAKNIPLITVCCNPYTKLKYDIMLTSYETVSLTDRHPSEKSQELIANNIYNLLQ